MGNARRCEGSIHPTFLERGVRPTASQSMRGCRATRRRLGKTRVHGKGRSIYTAETVKQCMRASAGPKLRAGTKNDPIEMAKTECKVEQFWPRMAKWNAPAFWSLPSSPKQNLGAHSRKGRHGLGKTWVHSNVKESWYIAKLVALGMTLGHS